MPSPRLLWSSAPHYTTHVEFLHISRKEYQEEKYWSLRGSPTPLLSSLDYNPHLVLTPVRQALYWYMGIRIPVRETFPVVVVVQKKTVLEIKWHEQSVLPKEDTDIVERFLQQNCSEEENLKAYFPDILERFDSGELWKKHCFCMRSLIFELGVQFRRVIITKRLNEFRMIRQQSLCDFWMDYEKRFDTRI